MRPGLYVSNEPLYVLGAGQHGLLGRDNTGDCYSGYAARATEDGRSLSESLGNRDLTMLAEALQSARLETRTKESNMYASRWV